MIRSARLTIALVGILVAVSAGAVAASATGNRDRSCPEPPLSIRVQAGGDDRRATLDATDAVARRVPIVPQPGDTARDPDTLERLRAKAAKTDLALYTLYLADFRIPRSTLEGFGFGDVDAPVDKTVVAVTIVPTKRWGFRAGDVARDRPFRYDTTTTFGALSVTVNRSGELVSYSYDDVDGRVRIRDLDESSICLDFDLSFSLDGDIVASAEGRARAPVVNAPREFFFT